MKTAFLALALVALALGAADTAAATCNMNEVLVVDPVKSDTGDPTVDSIVIRVGYAECHPPPMDDPQ